MTWQAATAITGLTMLGITMLGGVTGAAFWAARMFAEVKAIRSRVDEAVDHMEVARDTLANHRLALAEHEHRIKTLEQLKRSGA